LGLPQASLSVPVATGRQQTAFIAVVYSNIEAWAAESAKFQASPEWQKIAQDWPIDDYRIVATYLMNVIPLP